MTQYAPTTRREAGSFLLGMGILIRVLLSKAMRLIFFILFWAVLFWVNWKFNQNGPEKIDKDLEQLTGMIGAVRAKRELDRMKALHPHKSKAWVIQQLIKQHRR